MTLGEIIKNYRNDAKVSQDIIAEKTGLSKSYISILERNYNPSTHEPPIPSIKTIQVVSKAIGKTFDDVFSDLDEDTKVLLSDSLPDTTFSSNSNIFKIETRKIPLLGRIACGEPITANEEFEFYVEVGTEIKADFCLKASGDSMTGARIFDGDIVFIRKQDIVADGEIAAVIIDDEATLKRVYYDRDNNIISLFAENPNYKTLRYSGEELDHVRIIGKAIAFQSDIR